MHISGKFFVAAAVSATTVSAEAASNTLSASQFMQAAARVADSSDHIIKDVDFSIYIDQMQKDGYRISLNDPHTGKEFAEKIRYEDVVNGRRALIEQTIPMIGITMTKDVTEKVKTANGEYREVTSTVTIRDKVAVGNKDFQPSVDEIMSRNVTIVETDRTRLNTIVYGKDFKLNGDNAYSVLDEKVLVTADEKAKLEENNYTVGDEGNPMMLHSAENNMIKASYTPATFIMEQSNYSAVYARNMKIENVGSMLRMYGFEIETNTEPSTRKSKNNKDGHQP